MHPFMQEKSLYMYVGYGGGRKEDVQEGQEGVPGGGKGINDN